MRWWHVTAFPKILKIIMGNENETRDFSKVIMEIRLWHVDFFPKVLKIIMGNETETRDFSKVIMEIRLWHVIVFQKVHKIIKGNETKARDLQSLIAKTVKQGKYSLARLFSQGYIFLILQYFATKLCNFTK